MASLILCVAIMRIRCVYPFLKKKEFWEAEDGIPRRGNVVLVYLFISSDAKKKSRGDFRGKVLAEIFDFKLIWPKRCPPKGMVE